MAGLCVLAIMSVTVCIDFDIPVFDFALPSSIQSAGFIHSSRILLVEFGLVPGPEESGLQRQNSEPGPRGGTHLPTLDSSRYHREQTTAPTLRR